MNFEIEYIEKLANLADEKQLTEITVEDGDKAIIIKRGMQGVQLQPLLAFLQHLKLQHLLHQVNRLQAHLRLNNQKEQQLHLLWLAHSMLHRHLGQNHLLKLAIRLLQAKWFVLLKL